MSGISQRREGRWANSKTKKIEGNTGMQAGIGGWHIYTN